VGVLQNPLLLLWIVVFVGLGRDRSHSVLCRPSRVAAITSPSTLVPDVPGALGDTVAKPSAVPSNEAFGVSHVGQRSRSSLCGAKRALQRRMDLPLPQAAVDCRSGKAALDVLVTIGPYAPRQVECLAIQGVVAGSFGSISHSAHGVFDLALRLSGSGRPTSRSRQPTYPLGKRSETDLVGGLSRSEPIRLAVMDASRGHDTGLPGQET